MKDQHLDQKMTNLALNQTFFWSAGYCWKQEKVWTIELKDTVLTMCQERNDSWAHSVLARISSAHDLHAADAIYHKACDINFRTMRQIPTGFRKEKLCTKKVKLGRPEELDRAEAFLEVAKFLEENDDEQITINDLISKMEVILDGSEYSAFSRYICVPNLKSILDGSEYSAYSRYICVPNLKSILDGSEYSAYSRYLCVSNLKSILDGSEYSTYSRYMCVPNLKSILDGSEYSAYSRVHVFQT